VRRGVEADHRAKVGAGRREQRKPILSWAAQRALVGQDTAARTERLEREASEEAALRAFGARARLPVRLLVDVERGLRSLRSVPSVRQATNAAAARRYRSPGPSPSSTGGRSSSTELRGCRLARRVCSSGEMTSYGGLMTSTRSPTVAGS
jgi:hypothetical protein